MSNPTGFAPHDHRTCVRSALAAAEAACAERGARLTPLRRRALEILLESHKALGAYHLLDRLAAEGLGDKPPIAYRALNFLTEQGFAHRIERLNAYVACAHPEAGEGHGTAFLICRDCGRVAEALAETLSTGMALAADAAGAGFVVEDAILEAQGLCPQCQSEGGR